MSTLTVTAELSTSGRYDTTLPLVLHALAAQSVQPNEVFIFDDSRVKEDLRNKPIYEKIFKLMADRGIKAKLFQTPAHGQVKNHQKALETAKTDLIWRLDDDTVPQTDVLERLLLRMYLNVKVGAIGGLVVEPGTPPRTPSSSQLKDFDTHWNGQMDIGYSGPPEVDHLYSTFLYRKSAAEAYPDNLSAVGHGEETIFTLEMRRRGWALFLDKTAITWHYHATGGIRQRQYTNDLWDKDTEILRDYLDRVWPNSGALTKERYNECRSNRNNR